MAGFVRFRFLSDLIRRASANPALMKGSVLLVMAGALASDSAWALLPLRNDQCKAIADGRGGLEHPEFGRGRIRLGSSPVRGRRTDDRAGNCCFADLELGSDGDDRTENVRWVDPRNDDPSRHAECPTPTARIRAHWT